MKIPFLTFLKCLLGPMNQSRSWLIGSYTCSKDIGWMQKTLNVLWSGAGNMSFVFKYYYNFCWSNFWHYGVQDKTKKIFLLVGIFTKLRRFCLQLNNLDKLIFVNKNWPNDLKVGCSSLFDLIKLIESNDVLNEEYEGKFEKYEILDL